MSALYPTGIITTQISDQTFSGPAGPDFDSTTTPPENAFPSNPSPTLTPDIDYSFPAETFDISATNRNFQTNVIITQSPTRSGILSFMQERIEGSAPPPTRTDATGIRPDYGGQ